MEKTQRKWSTFASINRGVTRKISMRPSVLEKITAYKRRSSSWRGILNKLSEDKTIQHLLK